MPDSTPAAQLCAAVARLTAPLPGGLDAPPRLVLTAAETASGIAFCADDLLPLDGEYRYSVCDHCEVIDCKYEALAELLFGLLWPEQKLGAVWLENAESDLVSARLVGRRYAVCEEPTSVGLAISVARALNGEPTCPRR